MVALGEGVELLFVGQVEPTFSCDQELAADRSFGVVEGDSGACGGGDFGSAETGGPATDDRNLDWW